MLNICVEISVIPHYQKYQSLNPNLESLNKPKIQSSKFESRNAFGAFGFGYLRLFRI